jgi:L-malate glycosyltransferase
VGGVQEVMRQIAERLAAKGHQVTVATSVHPQRPTDALRNGVRVVSFPVSGNWTRGMLGPVDLYRRFVVDGNFDAICIKAAQQWTFDALLDVLPAIRARKVFIPCGFSGLYQRAYKSYFARMPQWLAQCDALIFYASKYRDIRFAQSHGIDNIHVLPNGADEREFANTTPTDLRARLNILPNNYLLLTVGSINGAKGHWEVARAFELAKFDRPATLLLNGNVPNRSRVGLAWQRLRELAKGRPTLPALVSRINNRQAGDKRVILTDLERTDVVQAFKVCDLFVFASHVEYSPLVLFEAAAAGAPFLTTPAGNAAEIVRWTGGGVVCSAPVSGNGHLKPRPHDLAAAMEALISEPHKLACLGSAGRNAFLEGGFSWAHIADRYERILLGNLPSHPLEASHE